jgi:hypothetical protein
MNPVANISVAVFIGLKNRVGFLGQTPQQPKVRTHILHLDMKTSSLLLLGIVAQNLRLSLSVPLLHLILSSSSVLFSIYFEGHYTAVEILG